MLTTNATRRGVLATIAAGIGSSIAGCTGTISANNEFQNQLDTVREATEQYADYTQAFHDGFRLLGPFVPGMGWHFAHPQRIQAAAQDGLALEEPQLLTYDAEMNLGSAEWGVPTNAVSESPDLFADETGAATENWHPHTAATHVLAVPDGQQTNPENIAPDQLLTNDHWAEFRPPDPDLKPGDMISLHWGSHEAKEETPKTERTVDIAQSHPDLTTLHAWVHADNPEGVFTPVNPDFAQSMGSQPHQD